MQQAKNPIAVIQVYHSNFANADTVPYDMGCPTTVNVNSQTACPAGQTQDSVLMGTSLKNKFSTHQCCDGTGKTPQCTGACISSVQMPTDLYSPVAGGNGSIVSNIIRMRFWNPKTAHTLAVTAIDSGAVFNMTLHNPTTITATQIDVYQVSQSRF